MNKEFFLHLFDKGRIGDDFDETFDELVRLGYLEVAGIDEKGECQYRLTLKGLLAPKGPA